MQMCFFVLLTRGSGKLKTRPLVALGSSQELSAFTMSLAPPCGRNHQHTPGRRERHGKIWTPPRRRHSRGLLVFGSERVRLFQTWISLLAISTLVR